MMPGKTGRRHLHPHQRRQQGDPGPPPRPSQAAELASPSAGSSRGL